MTHYKRVNETEFNNTIIRYNANCCPLTQQSQDKVFKVFT